MSAFNPASISRNTRCLFLALAVALTAAGIAGAVTPAMSSGMERCMTLEKQFNALPKTRKASLPWSSKELANQAHAFCSAGKTAQGARTYVKALKLLGIDPVLNK